MSQKPVQLIPLLCVKCQSPVPARPEEVAWVCATCGQGLVLDPTPAGGLSASTATAGSATTAACKLDVLCSSLVLPGKTGRPFWVSSGTVTIIRRETYKGNELRQAQEFWSAPRLFFVPGWAAAIEEVVGSGVQFLNTPFTLQPGPPVPFLPVVTLPEDMKALAEFMVMSIEAGRRDAMKHLDFDIKRSTPAVDPSIGAFHVFPAEIHQPIPASADRFL